MWLQLKQKIFQITVKNPYVRNKRVSFVRDWDVMIRRILFWHPSAGHEVCCVCTITTKGETDFLIFSITDNENWKRFLLPGWRLSLLNCLLRMFLLLLLIPPEYNRNKLDKNCINSLPILLFPSPVCACIYSSFEIK